MWNPEALHKKNVEKKEAFWPKYFGGRLKFVGNLRQLYSGIAFLTRENNSLYVNFIFFSPAAATFHIKIKYCVIAKHNCKNSAKYLGKIWFFDLGTFFSTKKMWNFSTQKMWNLETEKMWNLETEKKRSGTVRTVWSAVVIDSLVVANEDATVQKEIIAWTN